MVIPAFQVRLWVDSFGDDCMLITTISIDRHDERIPIDALGATTRYDA
jgi:hypothetical protein